MCRTVLVRETPSWNQTSRWTEYWHSLIMHGQTSPEEKDTVRDCVCVLCYCWQCLSVCVLGGTLRITQTLPVCFYLLFFCHIVVCLGIESKKISTFLLIIIIIMSFNFIWSTCVNCFMLLLDSKFIYFFSLMYSAFVQAPMLSKILLFPEKRKVHSLPLLLAPHFRKCVS